MKKLLFYTLTGAALLTTAGSPMTAQARTSQASYTTLKNGNCMILSGTVNEACDLEEILSKLKQEFANGNWNVCLPGGMYPGMYPGTNLPDTELPDNDSSAPDADLPDNDISTPDTSLPGNDSSTPDVNLPGNDSSDTDTNLPDTEESNPETELPGDQELSFAEQVVALVNQERAKAGLAELTLDKEIEAAALIRSKEIQQSFSHTRPNGSSFATVLKEQNISYRTAGENIAWGQRSPEAVMEAWMNSDGHRANILSPNFTKIGVGHIVINGTNYWTQLFTG